MKSWYQTGVLAGAASLAILAGTAHADDGTQGPLQVYDSRANLVGTLFGPDTVLMKINNQYYYTEFNANGLFNSAFFYYISNNCTGQRYMASGVVDGVEPSNIPPYIWYENAGSPGSAGHSMWNADYTVTAQTLTVYSLWDAQQAHCQTIQYPYQVVGLIPAVLLGTHIQFTPPFCLSGRNGQPCRTD